MEEFHIHSMDPELRAEFEKLNNRLDLLINVVSLICWFLGVYYLGMIVAHI